MNLFDLEMIPTHGGSIRVYVSKNHKKLKSQRLIKILDQEKNFNIKKLNEFKNRIIKHKSLISLLLKKLMIKGKKIIGYGASGRGTILLNFCKIDRKKINYIIDDSPLRFGKFMPGIKIPIYNNEYLKKNINGINYVLIVAWNYKTSIMRKLKKMNKKIKFIIPYPFPKIIK